MSVIKENAIVRVASDTAGNWTSNDPTLDQGEWGLETDTGYLKMGDGSTAWTALAYQPSVADVAAKPTGTTAQLCKAWVNFDGTTNVGGFCTIASSYNVTSVTDNGVGDYTINFTVAMSDANYVYSGSAFFDTNANPAGFVGQGNAMTRTTAALRIETGNTTTAANFDSSIVNVMVFGT